MMRHKGIKYLFDYCRISLTDIGPITIENIMIKNLKELAKIKLNIFSIIQGDSKPIAPYIIKADIIYPN